MAAQSHHVTNDKLWMTIYVISLEDDQRANVKGYKIILYSLLVLEERFIPIRYRHAVDCTA